MTSTSVLGYSTIMDIVNEYTSLDATGMYLRSAKVLHRACPLVQYLPMVKSNQIMSHVGVRESYLPTPGTRQFNYGVAPSASHSTPFNEGIAMFEDYSVVDEKMCKIQNDPNAWRQGKDEKKIEALTQKLEYEIIYGSLDVDPGSFPGLATRFASTTTYPNGDSTWDYNVYDGGGTGADTTSIWLMELGPDQVYTVYPPNLPAGLEIEDLGKDTYVDSSNLHHEVLRTHFVWNLGLVIDDERCVQRYANIETSGASNIFDPEVMIDLKNRLPGKGEAPGSVVVANRRIKTQMEIAALNKLNGYFSQDEGGNIWGQKVTRFQNMPVLCCEKIVNTETAI